MSPDVRLVLVVGPSGAGKDTLIFRASSALKDDSRFAFPRRVVTRDADASEDHDTMNVAAFEAAQAQGDFALHWQAHGLHYGVPRGALYPGAIIVSNVSRAIVAQARREFEFVRVVYITAPLEIRATRVAARGRETPSAARLHRDIGNDELAQADLVIDNCGTAEDGARALTAFLLALAE